MGEHSKFSASAAERWLQCPGSVPFSSGRSGPTSVHAARGTVAHRLLERCLTQSLTQCRPEWLGAVHEVDGHEIVVDEGLMSNVDWAVRHVGEIAAGCDIVQSESRSNYAGWLGVPTPDGWGTSDVTAVHIDQRELIVIDYKNGHKPVGAVDNPQLMLYAGGKLSEYEDVADIERVRMVILQPETGAPKEHVVQVDELRTWLRGRARSGAASVLNAERGYATDGAPSQEWIDTYLRPSPDACQWCRAKATCPKARGEVFETVAAARLAEPHEFELMEPLTPSKASDNTWLAAVMGKLDFIESWVDSVRKEVALRLERGESIPGYKLVAGKKGNRAWGDAAQAEDALKKMRLKIEEMYDLKLISPTAAEKLAKAKTIGPRQWNALQSLITQADGKPHVAPDSDPRSAITVQPVAEMFEVQAGDMV